MNFKFSKIAIVLLVLTCCMVQSTNAQQNDGAKPWVFWYWVQGAVSKPGITADLTAMKKNGIAGAYLMSIKGPSNPPLYQPAVIQLSPQWWEMVRFAMAESKRLGLKLGMHVSDGFALAGGPWITPALSMQKLVSSQVNLQGGAKQIQLPQPETNEGFYKDIAVYAYPSPVGTHQNTQTIVPKITTSNGTDASKLININNKENFTSSEPCWFQYEFEQPFTCRTIKIKTSGNNYQAQRLALSVSDDGKNFRSLGHLEAPRHGWQDTAEDFTFSILPTTAKFFRLLYDNAGSEPGSEDLDAAKWKPSLKLLNLQLSAKAEINQFEGKNGSVWRISKRVTSKEIPSELCVPLNKIIELRGKLNPDGSLNWQVPPGNWTILRIGHTTTGQKNATGGGGIGLECDKFNPVAVKLQFDNWYGEAIKQAGPAFFPSVLNTFHVDSWECGSQNWSSNFKEEFLKRRGYDLTPYLPIMTGLPIESAATAEDFLYDIRRTISELVVDQFYGTLNKLAKAKGVTFTAESIAPTMLSDGLLHYKKVDVPMGEFWLNSPTHDKPNDMLDAISGAHIYGKNIVQAEAFTTVRMDWNEHPGNMKTLQDRNFALGINKLVYHVFTHNPWIDQKPGMTLDGVGLYFQRDQTWWEAGKAWIEYATRCQQLLQQGKPVVDIAVFTGEELPRRSVLPNRLVSTLPGIFGADVVEAEKIRLANSGVPQRQIPAGVTHSANMADPEHWVNPLNGYAYDSFNPDVLLDATVKNGKVLFKSGAAYGLLIIPSKLKMNPNALGMSNAVVKKLSELVKAGATIIVDDQPQYQIGIKQVNADQFNSLVKEIWGGTFTEVTRNKRLIRIKRLGAGKVLKAPFAGDDFGAAGIAPDFKIINGSDHLANKIAYQHRKSINKDIYFIANQENSEQVFSASFRVAGKIPTLYDATNGEKLTVKNWKIIDGRTTINLQLAPNASIFVIFEAQTLLKAMGVKRADPIVSTVQDLSADWEVKFDPASFGPQAPITFNSLTDWTQYADSAIKYYSGTATYVKTFNFSGHDATKLWLNLGAFSAIAVVKINGIACGTLWTPPFRLPIGKALKQGVNTIEIAITNTWANRLIGDQQLPPNKRLTQTSAPFRLAGKPLNPAGLFGPVKIEEEKME
jgi:hypothetical protein